MTVNSAGSTGGGAAACTITNCTITGNSVQGSGGGASEGTLNKCTLTGNSAHVGGGTAGCTLINCALTRNSAIYSGGGANGGTLINCTLTGNSASYYGGVYSATLTNCIVFYNEAAGGHSWPASSSPNYDYSSKLSYCCTTPLPPGGMGNLDADPQMASATHLSVLSPCSGNGNPTVVSGMDIDGEPWANPPSIGCDEYQRGKVSGPMSVAIVATYTNVATGFPVGLTALIGGRTTISVWEFGDGAVEINQPYTTHAWTAPGDYLVGLWAFNETSPEGTSAILTVRVVDHPVSHVAAGSSNPVAPYTSWATAATTIQDAVDAAFAGGTILVTNGNYASGGRAVFGSLTNRVAVDKPLAVRSVNGPDTTIIRGRKVPGTINWNGAIRCMYLANGASVSGFTLTEGAADNGGGLWCESTTVVVSNCVLTGNSAGDGGGAYYGTLNNCTLTGNSAAYGGGAAGCTLNQCALNANSANYPFFAGGGGAHASTLNNCTLTGNSSTADGGGASYSALNNCALVGNTAQAGGGSYSCTLNNCVISSNSATSNGGGAIYSTLSNCIVYYNTAPSGANYSGGSWIYYYYCCTTPLPTNGVGNITNAPLFVNQAGGNLRLQSNSPCINAGFNSYAPAGLDLDGNPRIVGGTVDIGAYECQSPALLDYFVWLQNYGLPTSSSAVYADSDGDRMNNWQEWIAGTDPTNALSQLRLLAPVFTPSSLRLRWNSDTNHAYSVERTTSLQPPLTFSLLRSNVPGLAVTTTFIDTTAPATGAGFYRIGTDSTNGASPLWPQTPMFVPASVVVTWSSVTNRSYVLERSTNLATPMLFTPLTTNLTGQLGTTIYTDTNAVGPGPFFYRVGVQP